MAKLNPIEQSEFIEKEYREYLKDSFNFHSKEYQNQFIKGLEKESLYKGPYLNLNLPFTSSYSINELIDRGEMSPLFKKLSHIDFEQKLYTHQYNSLKKINDGKNVVITTGTGSGKTESFLYPILNSILRDIENDNNGPGIRAIFLYPMNALVNDQIDRIRKILCDYSEIRYGFYTGDTPNSPEGKYRNYKKDLEAINDCVIPDNEVLFRDEMRLNPPHLLFTNYSMLEYLLLRPKDVGLFNSKYLDHWKFVVLDEAHTYNGALGIELSYLLRRLTGLMNKKPQFLLTSATLGDKGKDEDKIIKFATSLTSADYTKDDIIFSDRVYLDKSNAKYEISNSDYIELDKNIEDINELRKIANKYNDIKTNDIKLLLYELLFQDKNVYRLYEQLVNNSNLFIDVLNNLKIYDLDTLGLVALIHLINKARKNRKMIYDIKYHTFIRTLSGAYVTLKPDNQLVLLPTKYLNDYRVFELANCRYCNTPYIIGKKAGDFLYQNRDVDIYENYEEDNAFACLDYFLIKENVQDETLDPKLIEKYTVCSKCGWIYPTDNMNAKKCDCGEQYRVDLYRVNSYSEKRNNITTCPICDHSSQRGVVSSLNLGKDAATAILSQILYKSMDSNEKIIKPKDEEFSFENFDIVSQPIRKEKIKQFLAFSDSRQQASFFASFFERNHLRFLRKRLIWEVIKNNNYEDIRFEGLLGKLESIISEKQLFDNNNYSSNKQAWITALYELLNVDGDYGAGNLGLFHYKLDLSNALNNISDDVIARTFGRYNINRTDLENIINVVFSLFRDHGAIDYTASAMTPEERKEEFSYRRFQISVKMQLQPGVNADGIYSFLPKTEHVENNQLKYIMKVCNCNRDEAINILKMLFINIGVRFNIFTPYEEVAYDAYRISVDKYVLSNYKNSKYYSCNKCGTITPFNTHNVCTNPDCDGILEECDPDKLFENNYYRKQYLNKKIERVIIKEHTAQLSSKEAKEYQKQFKNKLINILSCSTTFEMGVDIGDLETVFMRNVPPTPANYVQRAGRAGRSDDSSAFVLTFCGNSSHDYTYFETPQKMISGRITPPNFDLKNEKIVIRHLLAASLGSFFRRNPEYFDNIDKLVLNNGIDLFKKYIESKPEDLNEYINNKILIPEMYEEFKDYKWYEFAMSDADYLDRFVDSVKEVINDFQKAYDEAMADNKPGLAVYYENEIKKIRSTEVIEYLSKYNVIPKYGFPVDVVSLEIWENGKELKDKYDLDRDLSIAISEYAPESEIIVDKKKYTSRYIVPPKDHSEFTKNYYYLCPKCERDNVSHIPSKLKACQYCGESNDVTVDDFFIEPKYGFRTGENATSGTLKPKKTYTGRKIYLGKGVSKDNLSIKNGYLTINTTEDDELLVMNETNFFMCPDCGFTKIDKTKPIIYPLNWEHLNFKGYKCENQTLKGLRLGHRFKTDVATIAVNEMIDWEHAISFLYAILEGISQQYNIDRRDIDGIVVSREDGSHDLLIFDNVPGGAGHVKRILDENEFRSTLYLALEKVSQNCCDENTSCYNCLRNYENQFYHKDLKRINAKEVIEKILSKI